MGYAWQHLKHGNINTNTFSATTQTLHRIQKSLQSPLKEATDMPQESSYLPLQVFIFTYPPFQNYWHHRLVNTYTHYLWYEYNNPQLWGMMCEFSITRCVWVGGWCVQVNKTHIVFQNTLTVSLTRKPTISRRDLKVVWKCVYPRHYVRNAQVSVDVEWWEEHLHILSLCLSGLRLVCLLCVCI